MGAGASAPTIAWEPSCLTPSAAELVRAIKTSEKRCVDVVTAALERIDLVEGNNLRACVEVLRESALAQAAAVDAKVKAGGDLGALEGLPVVIKVNIDVAGTLSTASTPGLAEWRPATSAPCVEKLLAAGAIPLAKTNMPEMAVGFTGQSPVHGTCLNPRNTAYNCGGSSSGTAAAVAAGVAACGLGSDTGGSLRGPAALCGVVGFRPSRWPGAGVVPISALRDTPGPMGATVADVALLDAVVNGEAPVAAPDGLAGVAFGVPRDWLAAKGECCDAATRALEAAAAALASAGAAVEDVDGFHDVTRADADRWPLPFLPVPPENCRADLQAYLDGHASCPLKTVADVQAEMASDFIRATYDPVEGDDLPAKFAARDEGVAKLDGAYRAFFEARGIRALILPTFVGPPGRVDVEGYGGKALGNEYALLFHLNELRVPSLCLPIPSVAHGDTGIPASVLLYGVDDRELLGLALALETALRA